MKKSIILLGILATVLISCSGTNEYWNCENLCQEMSEKEAVFLDIMSVEEKHKTTLVAIPIRVGTVVTTQLIPQTRSVSYLELSNGESVTFESARIRKQAKVKKFPRYRPQKVKIGNSYSYEPAFVCYEYELVVKN